MKRNYTLVIKTLAAFIVLLGIQLNAWALETNAAENNSSNFFTQPWIWIAIIVVSIIILAGPFNYKKDYTVIMKKKNNTKKKIGESMQF